MSKRFGGFNYYDGDKKAIPLMDAWTYTIDGKFEYVPTAITAYSNFDVSDLNDGDGEVFIDVVHSEFTFTVSPREAKAIAQLLNNVADFIVEGRDEL